MVVNPEAGQGRPVCVKHHGQNKGEAKKRKLSKKRTFCGNRGNIHLPEIGEIYEFCGNRRRICNMHHWL